ncbi:hypothetical protein [Anaerocolumna xylanovorans]|uniref:Uncharacterized protein n=1 Tax=Anaerocolumna xylanovorans DSM 12503 TaxID=1121345 RepID=A0A1M7YC32_9FIRM|nr:hypothetical protein [Anaerocolumna xylanovorans]SHO50129.1 hypothetical protein SAMN02745217_02598 [Anaerocolumna xylanovorans DSM 12503]
MHNSNDLKVNGSGVRDVTAEKAIRKADHHPYEVTEMLEMLRKIADLWGYEIEGRVAFKNKKTGITYK